MQRERIMVVDDESEIAELLKDYLEEEQFEVVACGDGEQAVNMYRQCEPALIILDVMLPKLNGLEVCRIIRSESPVPIIMLSAKKSDVDKILGLGLGADDYVIKPFSPGEVVARVKAQLRRINQLSAPRKDSGVLRYDGLEIDLKAYNVKHEGNDIDFSAKEFEVLRFFALHPNRVFTREQLFENIWGFDEFGDINTVTVHIKKIREKLGEDLSNPRYIRTVWGVGYKFQGGKA